MPISETESQLYRGSCIQLYCFESYQPINEKWKKIGHSSNMLVSRQEGKRQNSSSLVSKSKKGRDMEELPKMAGIIFFNNRCIYSLIIIIQNLFLSFLWSKLLFQTSAGNYPLSQQHDWPVTQSTVHRLGHNYFWEHGERK